MCQYLQGSLENIGEDFQAVPCSARKVCDEEMLQSKCMELKLNGTKATLQEFTMLMPGFDYNYNFNAYIPFGGKTDTLVLWAIMYSFSFPTATSFLNGNDISLLRIFLARKPS